MNGILRYISTLGVSTYGGGLTDGLPDTHVLLLTDTVLLTALEGNCGAAAGMWHSLNSLVFIL
jgi:hypothetical protein